METFEQLKAALERKPFVPLTLKLTRGRTFEVTDPAQTLLTRGMLLIGRDIGPDGVPENYAQCPIVQLTSIETD